MYSRQTAAPGTWAIRILSPGAFVSTVEAAPGVGGVFLNKKFEACRKYAESRLPC